MAAGHTLFRLSAATLLLAAAVGRSSAAAKPSAEWRSLLATEYIYKPVPAAPKPADDRPPWLLAQAPAPIDPSIVQLAPFEVRSSAIYGELHQAFANEADAAKRQYIADRLGIGFKGFQSKHAAIGVVTIFYIPVMILGGVTW